MKSKLLPTLLLLTVPFVHAQTVRDKATHTPLKISPTFLVTITGINIFTPGAEAPAFVDWSKIDLAALATEEPEIAKAKEAVELGEPSAYFTRVDKPNLLAQFVALPYRSNFTETWTPASLPPSPYRISGEGFVSLAPRGNELVSSGFATLPTDGSADTTIEELFMSLSRENDSYVLASIKKIQSTSPNLFIRLKGAIERLLLLYPKDAMLTDTVKALESLAHNVDTNAQRQLVKFVQYAKSAPGDRTPKNPRPAPPVGSRGTR
ncbi:MAG: hypothetical protein WCL04_04955 [Verrucomicrobiota bacterium]